VLHLPSDCFLVVEVDIPPQMVVLARVTRCKRTRGRSGREFEFGWRGGGELGFIFICQLFGFSLMGGSTLVI